MRSLRPRANVSERTWKAWVPPPPEAPKPPREITREEAVTRGLAWEDEATKLRFEALWERLQTFTAWNRVEDAACESAVKNWQAVVLFTLEHQKEELQRTNARLSGELYERQILVNKVLMHLYDLAHQQLRATIHFKSRRGEIR